MTKKNFNKLMHMPDIEKAYKNDKYPNAECMLTYPEEVTDNRPFTPAGITLKPLTITRNGEYNPADFDADGFSWVDAEIEFPPEPVLDSIRITENGTYTPPAGVDGYNEITTDIHPTETLEEVLDERKTYNFIGEFNNAEITVDIPYTDIHVISGPVATFEGEDLPIKELKASITPLQAGSGDPSPENERPIIPWTECVITLTDDTTPPTVERTTTIPFTNGQGQIVEIFNGYVDVVNGNVKTVATGGLQPLANWNWVRESAGGGNYRFRSTSRVWDIYERASSNCISSAFTINRSPIGGAKVDNTLWVHTDGLVYVYCDSYTDAAQFKEFVKNTQLLLPRITPIEYNLSDVSIYTLNGVNKLWANTGDVYVEYQTEWTGESSIVYNAENLLVADEGGQYITNDLELALVAGKVYVGEINDVSSSELVPFLFTRDANTSQIITLRLANEIAYLTFTNTTASLSNYAGSFRKIYLRLSEVVDGQLY